MNLYPAIDLKDGQCVRLNQGRFDAITTYSSDPVEVAHRWKSAGAKWLHMVDLDGSREGKPNLANRAVVARVVQEVGVPVQLGGGVRSAESVQHLLDVGVTRVVIGTSAVRDPEMVSALFARYGESLAIGVDARDGKVAVQGWLEVSDLEATDFVVKMAEIGAKRFIFTDIARDGMLQGVNREALTRVATQVPHLPVIASGGVSNLEDIRALCRLEASTSPNVDGVIIGKALYTGGVDLKEALALVKDTTLW